MGIMACICGFGLGNGKIALMKRVFMQLSTNAHSMATLSMGEPALH
jgi:hypothetical protein